MDLATIIIEAGCTLIVLWAALLSLGFAKKIHTIIGLIHKILEDEITNKQLEVAFIQEYNNAMLKKMGEMETSIQDWQKAYTERFANMVQSEIKRIKDETPIVTFINSLEYARDKFVATPSEKLLVNRIIKRINDHDPKSKTVLK